MDKSFKEFLDEFENNLRTHKKVMDEKRRKEAENKNIEKNTPEVQGRIYDLKNDQDYDDATKKLKDVKNKISDIRELGKYRNLK